MVTQDQLDSFHRFASEQLRNGGADATWQELFHLWRLENPSAEERTQIHAAIRQSLHEVDAGLARPAAEVMEKVRQEFGFPTE